MTLSVVFTPSAQQDLISARDSYANVSLSLGRYCKNSLLSDVSRLNFTTGVHPLTYGHYRALARNFPFSIYYKILEPNILIVAVLDNRKNPGAIFQRLTE